MLQYTSNNKSMMLYKQLTTRKKQRIMARLLFKTDHQSNIDHETTMRYTRIYKYNTID